MYPMFEKVLHTAVIGALLCGGAAIAGAQATQEKSTDQTKPVQSDNTKVNKRDRDKSHATADRASNSANDRELMRNIRKSIVDDKSLSTYAHNVKVIAQNGKVTLKGPVRSEEEKTSVVSKATEVAGAGNVTDELTVKPEKPGKKAGS